MNKYHTKIY